MKTIVILFVLLLPSGAWAAETIVFNTDRNRFEYADGRLVPHHRLEAGKVYQTLRDGETQCLAKMEAAMKAMDKYLDQEEPYNYAAQSYDENSAQWDRTIEQWKSTKRDCWRATGSPGTP